MHITSGMLHFYTKHPWVIDIFFIFHSFFIPRGIMEKSETWQILLNLRTPTRWLVHKHSVLPQTLSNSEDKDNGIPIFYCCHIPLCFVLPNQLNMSSVKTGACELRWAWGSIWNWGLKIVERKCAYFFFVAILQRIFCKPKCVFYYGLHQQADLRDFCLCVFL